MATTDADRTELLAARLDAHAQATHVLHAGHGASTWTVAGPYDPQLRNIAGGWRLTSLTLHADWAAGNQQLAVIAGQDKAT